MSVLDWFRRPQKNRIESILPGLVAAEPRPAVAPPGAATARVAAIPPGDLALAATLLAPATEPAVSVASALTAPPAVDPQQEAADTDLLRSAFDEAESTAASPLDLLAAALEDVDPASLLNQATQVLAMARWG